MKINKYKLILILRDKLGTTIEVARRIVNVFTKTFLAELLQGNEIMFGSVGTFSIITRKSRNGIIPVTKERIIIPETKAIKFQTTRPIRKLINNR